MAPIDRRLYTTNPGYPLLLATFTKDDSVSPTEYYADYQDLNLKNDLDVYGLGSPAKFPYDGADFYNLIPTFASNGVLANSGPDYSGVAMVIHDFEPIEGPQGPTGATGATGATGSTGSQGPAGFSGITVNTPSRSLNSDFQPSSTLPTMVFYTVELICTANLSGGETATVELRSDSASTPTTVRTTVRNANSVSLAIALTLVNTHVGVLSYIVPAGHNVRLVSSATGSPTITLLSSVEVALGT